MITSCPRCIRGSMLSDWGVLTCMACGYEDDRGVPIEQRGTLSERLTHLKSTWMQKHPQPSKMKGQTDGDH